ncbi:MAG: alpha/beta fold hydrolase [Burkholderiales bacterium]
MSDNPVNSLSDGAHREPALFVEAGGRRLEYRWFEPAHVRGGMPVLVFLHEGLGSVALWKTFPADVAAATGCPALVYSRHGYGKSETLTQPRAVDYMHREALDVLPDVLNQLGIHKPVLIGHSDGASIALIHAGAGRQALRGLVVMAPHVFVEDITIRSIEAAKHAFHTSDLPARLGRYHDDVQSTFRGWNDIWLDPDFRRWNIEEFLPGIRCPVLALQGEDDEYGSRAQIDAIGGKVSAPVRSLLLPHCAHSPQVDQKSATLQAIREFVASLSAVL